MNTLRLRTAAVLWFDSKVKIFFLAAAASALLFSFGCCQIFSGLSDAVHTTTKVNTRMTLKNMTTSLEIYISERERYPDAANIHELVALLEPTGFRSFPTVDGWNYPLHYSVSEDGYSYILGSAGADGKFHKDLSQASARNSGNYDCDIVVKDGDWYYGNCK